MRRRKWFLVRPELPRHALLRPELFRRARPSHQLLPSFCGGQRLLELGDSVAAESLVTLTRGAIGDVLLREFYEFEKELHARLMQAERQIVGSVMAASDVDADAVEIEPRPPPHAAQRADVHDGGGAGERRAVYQCDVHILANVIDITPKPEKKRRSRTSR